ncbi:MAG: hypothetical protein HONBIEJF_02328 [Fimbriimonadaceae bacterium]|nr:hypothetical protein [Fimbriimonadaceae bacterium]
MTEREKIAHALRRFGLGAGAVEMAQYESLGLEGTLKKLIDYDSVDEGFPISPWELCFDEGTKEVYLDPFRSATWWALRFLLTKRPLQEKLTLFWHDHFAVSAEKIEFGPAMIAYIGTLRQHGAGSFETLLKGVSKEPAMIRWLDTDASYAGMPNENFAREVLELFTMGKGYSERDIQEAARCFTGWGNRYLVFEPGAEKLQQTAREMMAANRPMIAFCLTPDLHDSGEKTVLGQTARFDGDQLLTLLVRRPETSRFIVSKLWYFFAGVPASNAVVDRLAKIFTDSRHEIRPVLWAIARSPEFWNEEVVRKQHKSPLDFSVALARQFGLRDTVLILRGQNPAYNTPLAKPARDAGGLVLGTMYKQGMLLLYPPNVGGWEWGRAWVSSSNMAERMKFGDLIFPAGAKDQPLAAFLLTALKQPQPPTSDADLVRRLMDRFDVPSVPEKAALLEKVVAAQGGVGALKTPADAAPLFREFFRAFIAMPEFQLN